MRKAMLLAPALAALACASVQVTTEAAPGADFSGLETFAQAAHDGAAPQVQDAVHAEIGKQLEEKGFRRAPHDEADFVVAFQARGEPRARLALAGDPDAPVYRVRRYVAGTLVIDVFRVGSADPMWHGVARTDITRESQRRRSAERAVRAVLAEFPPTS